VLSLPDGLVPRLRRQAYRVLAGYWGDDLADLFHRAGVGVLFPTFPCENFGVPLVGYIADLQNRRVPKYFTPEQSREFDEQHRLTGRHSTLIMVSSEAVLDDVREFFPDIAPKCRVVRPCSVPTSDWGELDPAAVAARHGLPESFFLISNQVNLHKNHRTVVEAVHGLAARGVRVDVVCTGKAEGSEVRDLSFFGRLRDEIERRGIAARFRFLGSVPRPEHIALMRRCLAVLQPSEFEGWGFAVSDAKALGKPVIASDLPVHREHGASLIQFLPPLDAGAWSAALERASRELRPGPDPRAEAAALAENAQEIRRVGRGMVALFREAMDGHTAYPLLPPARELAPPPNTLAGGPAGRSGRS
jgi:glycosyltransferase involved in cell wall biosynthesis